MEIIQRRRPDLWGKQDIQTFHYSLVTPVCLGLGGIALIFYVFNSGESNPNWFGSIIGFLTGLFLIGYAIVCRIKLFFDGDKIVVKYIAWERLLHAREIDTVIAGKSLIFRIGKKQLFSVILQQVISLKLRNGQAFYLGNVKEDRSIFLNTLQKWAKTYLPISS